MNIGVIAGIGGGVAVAVIAVIAFTMMNEPSNVSTPNTSSENFELMKSELDNCMRLTQQITPSPFVDQSQNERIVEELENCIANVEDEYVTDEIREIIDELKSNPSQFEKQEFTEDELAERKAEYIQTCYELFTGQTDELNSCLYWADTAIKYGD